MASLAVTGGRAGGSALLFQEALRVGAAMQPVPALVMAWRYTWSCTSPAAKMPGTWSAANPVQAALGDDVAVLQLEWPGRSRCWARGRWR